ncbi:hypothetical protein TNCV_3000771 [Trichonephila clavipes]|nr:hypothetical protein TNCV_3000771 [Trichonephila clavipes]
MCSDSMMDEVDQPPVKIQCLEGNIKKKKIFQKPRIDKTIIDLALAKMFYACNIPFAVAENESLKILIHIPRASFTPTSRKELTGPLLDAVYNEMGWISL